VPAGIMQGAIIVPLLERVEDDICMYISKEGDFGVHVSGLDHLYSSGVSQAFT
jgi:hypothetical protein